MVKETLIIDSASRSLSEVDRLISRGLGGLRCPTHGLPPTYDPPSLETASAAERSSYSVEVICCCAELLTMASNVVSR